MSERVILHSPNVIAAMGYQVRKIPMHRPPTGFPKPTDLDRGIHPLQTVIVMGVIGACLLFVGYSIHADIEETGARVTTYLPFILLLVALLIALGFEFVNGFHDTANAVATVIYTRSLPAHIADVPAYAIVGGIPAQVIKLRFPADIANRLAALAWWDWDHARLRQALPDFRALAIEAFLEKYGDKARPAAAVTTALSNSHRSVAQAS